MNKRFAPLDLSPDEFRRIAHRLSDDIADFLSTIRDRKVNPAETPSQVRKLLGTGPLPERGTDASELVKSVTRLLIDHSLFNGHPAFYGYITSSAAPIGALADFLASAVNSNVGSFQLAPVATEIERQTVRWIAEMSGYPVDCGGILVSGGNMANFVCFLAARDAQCPTDARKAGVQPPGRVRVYSSVETHTWVKKAANFFGLGTDAIRWVPADEKQRMDVTKLDSLVREDLERGNVPLMVIGTAGSVATGAVDPLRAIGDICAKYKLWFHIDGAYGGFAAILDDPVPELRNLALGDSLAIDPHKWLYAPVEAGCALVRDPSALRAAFSYRPDYYRFGGDADDQALNYFEYGPQNSRGFRALKVWLALRQIGREGYRTMIGDDCRLAEELYREVEKYRELEAVTQGLSITTFRYVPPDLRDSTGEESDYLNSLNEEILTRIQNGGHAYVSNAVVGGKFVLRACIVNFRTTGREVRELPKLVVECGIAADTEIRARVRPVAR